MLNIIDDVFARQFKFKDYASNQLNFRYGIFFSKKESDAIMKYLDTLEFNKEEKVFVFGKWHPIPRQQVAYGDVPYTFSGKTVHPEPWTSELIILRDLARRATGCPFNFVLINKYLDGKHYIGYHRDDEKEIVTASPITCFSFGAPRQLVFKRFKRKDALVKQTLDPGSILTILYPSNEHWQHSVPRCNKVTTQRISLTFRYLKI